MLEDKKIQDPDWRFSRKRSFKQDLQEILSVCLFIRLSPIGLSQAQGGRTQVLGGPNQALEGQIQALGGPSQAVGGQGHALEGPSQAWVGSP